jgi:hypothetical protein
LSLIHKLGDSKCLHLCRFAIQKLINQTHFVKIPEVLVVETGYTFIFVFEDAKETSFSITDDAE